MENGKDEFLWTIYSGTERSEMGSHHNGIPFWELPDGGGGAFRKTVSIVLRISFSEGKLGPKKPNSIGLEKIRCSFTTGFLYRANPFSSRMVGQRNSRRIVFGKSSCLLRFD
ncbi:Hypothetical protein LEPBI_I2505 [Leptospira biflexa serovar Patoc strain 'Patoc 1 (Paris)']|uniref:Uncharacterized protein n=1 Tax=Leptospira biflexa serovar Patoc (strain Patoc 1 / ATCC 23582 / Paris) TaxID=456481 RepID=B0SLK5_LEPBP|nr:Hypothetical protein LEPBI_I2505 [Leptospira biflexa serovar Patoc strain 'Patoc 1 (Paris)']